MNIGTLGRPVPPLLAVADAEDRNLLLPGMHTAPLPITPIDPAPCTQACPAGINVKAYVSLIAEGRFQQALEEVRLRCPLPGVCGRICHAPCELACNRNETDQPVAIRALKRFIADLELHVPLPQPLNIVNRSERVAIIGSGPAGLTAAHDLRRAGFPVTIFEAESEPGGMLRYGIADYRLPPNVLEAEIQTLLQTGVELRTGVRLGRDVKLEKLLRQDYRAVLLAMGAPNGRHLGLDGEMTSDAVEDALAFLRRVNGGERVPMPKRVLVIGGGSTAIEAARTARRLGAKSVEILYRRSPQEVLASHEEVEAAKAEGVRFRFLVAPHKLLFDGKVFRGLECTQVALGEEDSSGRRRPISIPGTEFPIHADRLLAAVGQEADLAFLPSRGRSSWLNKGRLSVDEITAMTRLTGVFAAGDLVTGPATVIEAIAAGHRAADSIRRLIETGSADAPAASEPIETHELELPDVPPISAARQQPATRAFRPGGEFDEVEQVLNREQAVAEARRCQRCGPCSECRICASSCQRRHVTVRPLDADDGEPSFLVRAPVGTVRPLPSDQATSGWVLPHAGASMAREVDTSEGVAVEVRPARAHVVEERCRGCAACVEVCAFEAVSVGAKEGLEARAHIEPTLCRGCNLCTAVCSTDAAVPARESLSSWNTHGRMDSVEGARLILSCEKRAAQHAEASPGKDARTERRRLRCVGEVEVGQLVDLIRRGARQVVVDACSLDDCHYGKGAAMAQNQVEEARAVLRLLGSDENRVVLNGPSLRTRPEPVADVVADGVRPAAR